jgi:tetratricopeptide (TPR) repeat protein
MRARLLLLFVLLAFPIGFLRAQEGGGQQLFPYVGVDILTRGDAALEAGNFEAAALDYSLFIYLNPTAAVGYFERARAYTELERLDDALADMNTALSLPAPSEAFTAILHDSRARLHLRLNDLERALSDFTASIAAAPDRPDAYFARATIYQETGDFELALADWDQVLAAAPDNVQSRFNRAQILTRLERYAAAQDDYTRLIAAQPREPRFYAGRAMTYFQQGDPELALADINRAVELDAENPVYRLQRAGIYQQVERPADAAQDYLAWVQAIQRTENDRVLTLIPGVSQFFLLAQGDVFVLRFEADAGRSIRLSATSPADTPVDSLLVVLDPTGNPLIGNDDSGGRLDAALIFDAPVTGIYSVVLSHALGNPNGPVRVRLEFE